MSDLRQQLEELVSEWRKRVVALFPDDLTRRAELTRCVSQLDALVRAASPPAPPIEFDNHHNALACPYCNPDKLILVDGKLVKLPPASPVDADVVRGRVDGAAGGVRSAGPPQEKGLYQGPAMEEFLAGGAAGPQAPPPQGSILDGDPRWQRLYSLVCELAHPKGDHRENPYEDEAHDLIRELREKMAGLRVAKAETSARGDAARVPPATPQEK